MRMRDSSLKTRQASLFGKGGVEVGRSFFERRTVFLLLSHIKLFHLQPLFLPLRLIVSATRGSSYFFLDSPRAPIIFSRQFDVNLDATPSSPFPMIEDSTSEARD
jgi:hypothetical protein